MPLGRGEQRLQEQIQRLHRHEQPLPQRLLMPLLAGIPRQPLPRKWMPRCDHHLTLTGYKPPREYSKSLYIYVFFHELLDSDINECEDPERYHCYGECTNLFGTYECRCPRGSHGNSSMMHGCVKSSTGNNHCNLLPSCLYNSIMHHILLA